MVIIPDLAQALYARDFGFIRIVSQHWGIDLQAPDVRAARDLLTRLMLDQSNIIDIFDLLPAESIEAVRELIQNNGFISWTIFKRKYGDVREMGAVRRDRERPDLNDPSVSEILWYRSLIGRDFFDTEDGPEELVYIPHDLSVKLPIEISQQRTIFGQPANLKKLRFKMRTDDRILDDTCTLLAALRSGYATEIIPIDPKLFHYEHPSYSQFLIQLLKSAGLVDQNGYPIPEESRSFLELARADGLLWLFQKWRESHIVDELGQLPGLVREGEWKNDSRRTRQLILDWIDEGLSSIEDNNNSGFDQSFIDLDFFIAAIKNYDPDFQRPAGDYDSWYIQDEISGEYLRGFEYWDQIDGEIIRYMIVGPLQWLGIVDLAGQATQIPKMHTYSSFKYSLWAKRMLTGKAPQGLKDENGKLKVSPGGLIQIPRTVPRTARYQISRFGQWIGRSGENYAFQLNPGSLQHAQDQGLRVSQLVTLLSRHADLVPPSLIAALERWGEHGSQVRIGSVTILKVENPEIMAELRISRAARFFDELLGPTTVIIKPGAVESITGILAELGYLAEIIER